MSSLLTLTEDSTEIANCNFINQIKYISAELCLGFLTSLTCGIVPCSLFLSPLTWRHAGLEFGPNEERGAVVGEISGLPRSLPLPDSGKPVSPAVSPHTYSRSGSECPTFSSPECHASASCRLHKTATALKPRRGSCWLPLVTPSRSAF